MNIIASLTASAEAFDVIGLTSSSQECRRLIRECRIADALFGEGAGDALTHAAIAASSLAIRAADQLERFNRREAA